MKPIKATILTAALAAAPFLAIAHDGHGLFNGHQLAHYLSSPGHAIPLLAVIAVAALFGYRAWASRNANE